MCCYPPRERCYVGIRAPLAVRRLSTDGNRGIVMRTLRVKLLVDDEERRALFATMEAYTEAYDITEQESTGTYSWNGLKQIRHS